MENKPLIKWHAQELYKLLLQDRNDPMTADIATGLEAIFFNSTSYKDIKVTPPEERKKN